MAPIKLVMKLRCITVSAALGKRLCNGDKVNFFEDLRESE